MSPAEFVLFPLACALVFIIGYTLHMGERPPVWPYAAAVPSIIVGLTTENERLSVYVFVGAMFALRGLAIVGTAMINTAVQRLEESK